MRYFQTFITTIIIIIILYRPFAKPTLIFFSADKGRSQRYSSVILTVKFSYTFVRAVDIH